MNRKRRRSFFRDAVTADWLRRGMRVPFILASVMCSLAWADGGEVPVKKSQGRKLGLSIQVQGGGWGRGRKESIETVLNAVADELLPRLPSGLTAPIVVTHTDGPPMALYGRGPGGEFRIRLHARDENWHLYAYEFAHELCHVMSNYDAQPARPGGTTSGSRKPCARRPRCSPCVISPSAGKRSRRARMGGRGRPAAALLRPAGLRRPPPPAADAPLAAWLQAHEDEPAPQPLPAREERGARQPAAALFEHNPDNWQALAT
jgi:hypothetical protein